ncbi:Clavaminate synthase-like protein [Colletotrichum eremochloae]|nr:Clavaminate synthase-like protein [Colletotrichum eremochloae]
MASKQPLTVDFSLFSTGSISEKLEIANRLAKSIHETGFCRLINHDVSKETLDRLFSQSAVFFKLPFDVKSKVKHPPTFNPHRGWSEVGRETVSTVTDYEKDGKPKTDKPIILDIKEAFDMGNIKDPLFENMWLPEEDCPGFRRDMERFYEECRVQHLLLLEALELGCSSILGFTPDFRGSCRDSVSECRVNYYPATRSHTLKNGCNRISPHADFGTLTLLFQDGVGGLEIEDQNCLGRFFPVTCANHYELLVNAGDVLQRWSGDFFRSVNHLVTLPVEFKDSSEDKVVPERTSVAFFAKADRGADVGTMEGFNTKARKYEHMTSLQYNQLKLKLTYGMGKAHVYV